MKIIRLITAHLFLIFFFYSCEKEIEFSGQLPPSKLVMNCFISPESPIQTTISKSWNITEENGELLKDAEVSLFVNNEFKGLIPTNPHSLQPTHISDYIPEEGDIVKLSVKKDGFKTITAETEIPAKAKIVTIDSVRLNKNPYYYTSMRFYIKFNDIEKGKNNYYRLVVTGYSKTINIDETGSEVKEIDSYESGEYESFMNVSYNYDQDPALKDGYFNVTEEMLGTDIINIYGIFSDNLFDGKDYTLNISFEPWNSHESKSEDALTRTIFLYQFKLITLSEPAYLYLKSRTLYDYNGYDDPFAEPGIIFSNIDNGLGILGGFQIDTINIEMPVYYNDWDYIYY